MIAGLSAATAVAANQGAIDVARSTVPGKYRSKEWESRGAGEQGRFIAILSQREDFLAQATALKGATRCACYTHVH
jgi:hypothetical protein